MRHLAAAAVIASSCASGALQAQPYPVKPIRLVVGFPAGGPTDIVARTLAPKLTEALGQQVIVDNGTVTHLAGELFKLMGKVEIVHVPFKGGAPALTALISGEVDMSYENSLVVTPHVKAGKVRALAVTGAKRSDLMPELPTVAETLPGYNASGWYGLFVPAATPKPIVARLHADAAKALRMPDVVRVLSSQGAEPVGNTPEEFSAFVRSEIAKWAELVKVAKMKAD